jgi:predicted nucleotide-binding protein
MNNKKRNIFIGSSINGLEIAKILQVLFEYNNDFNINIWNQGVFGLSEGTLESLVKALKKFDFAILILTPDDMITSEEINKNSPRDNVVFELGLFMGGLGRNKTFIVYDRSKKIKLPSDIAGITPVTFDGSKSTDLESILGSTATKIEQAIKKIIIEEDNETNLISTNIELKPVSTFFVEGKEAVQDLTKYILDNSNGSFYQSHILSNSIPEQEDFLNKITSNDNIENKLDKFCRIIGITDNNDINFAKTSLSYAENSNKLNVIIKLLNTLSLKNDLDSFPNFCITNKLGLITFPCKNDNNTCAIFFNNPEFSQRLYSWFENFSSNMSLAQNSISGFENELEKEEHLITNWVIETIAWLIKFELPDVKCITLMGSFSDTNRDDSCLNDIDILIIFDNIDTDIFLKIKYSLDKICNFFSSYKADFSYKFDECPIYIKKNYKKDYNLIHILLSDYASMKRWPSQIKRTRYFQHKNLYGSLKKEMGDIPQIISNDYINDKYGLKGILNILETKNISYHMWTDHGRISKLYHYNDPYELLNISIYSILKSAANLLDLTLEPHYFEYWNGSNFELQERFKVKINNDELCRYYSDAIGTINHIRKNGIIPTKDEANNWNNKAIIFIKDIINYFNLK